MLRPLLAALALASATYPTDVPSTFGTRVDKARKASGVRVLLPGTLRTEFKRLYPNGSWEKGHYELQLGAARGCRGATVCFVAAFIADEGARLHTGRKVALARGRTGWFARSTCGASCTPPQIQWNQRGVLYTIQAKDGGSGRTDRARLVSLANAAIRGGAR